MWSVVYPYWQFPLPVAWRLNENNASHIYACTDTEISDRITHSCALAYNLLTGHVHQHVIADLSCISDVAFEEHHFRRE